MNRNLLLAATLGATLLVGCAVTGGTPFDESELTGRIRQELALDPLLNSSGITVTETDGRVVIAGFVDNLQDANAIRDIVKGVDGVVDVENNTIIEGDS